MSVTRYNEDNDWGEFATYRTSRGYEITVRQLISDGRYLLPDVELYVTSDIPVGALGEIVVALKLAKTLGEKWEKRIGKNAH